MAWYRPLSLITFLLCFCVVVFGAYVRLSDAGLSCPDWPTCYGKATWPTREQEVAQANQVFPQRPVETGKAWREQVHRHLAATLGVLVLGLALLAADGRRHARKLILGASAAVAMAIGLYIAGRHGPATALVAAAELALIGWALAAPSAHRSRLMGLTLSLIIFQAVLGMWTVTWQLKPLVVTGHLLGGLATLSLLLWNLLASRQRATPALSAPYTSEPKSERQAFFQMQPSPAPATRPLPAPAGLRAFALAALVAVGVQTFLGGWTSTNYAALACPDLPTCQGEWVPETDVATAYTLWHGLGIDYEYGILDNRARVTIHFFHRVGAVVATVVLAGLAIFLWWRGGTARWRGFAVAVAAALAVQVAIGITIVKLHLPLLLAVGHNAGAALLLVTLIALNHQAWSHKAA